RREGRVGEARARGARRHQDQGTPSLASGHVVACASEGVERPACIKGSDPQWSLQHRGQIAPPAATSRERDVRFGSVPYKDSGELCIACVLSAHTLSVQKGSLRYQALFDFAAVLHNEMD